MCKTFRNADKKETHKKINKKKTKELLSGNINTIMIVTFVENTASRTLRILRRKLFTCILTGG